MTQNLTHTFVAQAEILQTRLQSFNDAASLKDSIHGLYKETKSLLRRAQPHLDIDICTLPHNGHEHFKIDITDLDIQQGRLTFNTGRMKGMPVKESFDLILDVIKTATPR